MPDKVKPPTLAPANARLAKYDVLGDSGKLGNPHAPGGGFADSPLAGRELAVIDLATVSTPFFVPRETPVEAPPAPAPPESGGGDDGGAGATGGAAEGDSGDGGGSSGDGAGGGDGGGSADF